MAQGVWLAAQMDHQRSVERDRWAAAGPRFHSPEDRGKMRRRFSSQRNSDSNPNPTSILARAMGVALGCPTMAYPQHNREAVLWIGIASMRRRRRRRPVTALCLRRRVPTMRDSHNRISDFPAEETSQIALIPRCFDFTWNSP